MLDEKEFINLISVSYEAMQSPISHSAQQSPFSTAVSLADTLADTLRIAKALLQAGRAIDVIGLEDLTGQLCARVLDLPIEEGRSLRNRLILLRQALDGLHATLVLP